VSGRRARILAVWLALLGAAIWIVARAPIITDLSAFLPAQPTPLQRLLVEQLRDGPASRLILVALEGGTPALRARVSLEMGRRLRTDAAFTDVENGAPRSADRDREFLFEHRYLLSDAVTRDRFTAAGLRAALADTIDELASSTGLLAKALVPHDPTGEMLHVIDALGRIRAPRTVDGVWVSADGARTVLVAQTAAAGSDTDAQERDLGAIEAAFRAGAAAVGAATGSAATSGAASAVRLKMSGPGVFAVAARAKIKRAATRLSLISSLLVVAVLLVVYRSLPALGLGLLPVATGAVTGIAAVALGFGAVHGVTLGFGITLIGESVDYSVYFFIQSARAPPQGGAAAWRQRLWPTVRLGMLTSVCGFASLLPSGFPGLAQLGLYSISGLIAAACVTRFVLPELLPRRFAIRDLTPLGVRLGRARDSLRGRAVPGAAAALALAALGVLLAHHATLWNHELSALSPIPETDQRYDARLRADLGTADVLDLVVVDGADLEAVLQGAERAGGVLQGLVEAGVIGGFDSPATYLPSRAAQQRRQSALPERGALAAELRQATADLELAAPTLAPFLDDVAAARRAPLVGPADLRGTSLAAGFAALVLHGAEHRWSALLPLHAASGARAGAASIDLNRVAAALAAARLEHTQVLDLKAETDALYAGYLSEAIRLSACGLVLITVLLIATLRSVGRTARVLAPLVLAVLTVAAVLAACGRPLNILHLVGMLLIVAVGSNYALFFDHEAAAPAPQTSALTLASLGVANLCTVIAFGLLSFSQVPVLEALGMTVAPGALLALLFAAVLSPPAAPSHA
jgi:predicted exporter